MHIVDKFDWTNAVYGDYDIQVQSVKLYSMGLEAYGNLPAITIHNRHTHYPVNYPNPDLVQAINIWWDKFRSSVTLTDYLREVFSEV